MAWQSNDRDAIDALLQAAVNKNQAGIQQAQTGNRFQNLLSIAAMSAAQNANPNSEIGRIMGGAGNTYLNNLVGQNQNSFRNTISGIHMLPVQQDPNTPQFDPYTGQRNWFSPQEKYGMIAATLSRYGQDPKDYKDILDVYGKQIQYQGTSNRQAQTDQFRQQQLDMQRQTLDLQKQKAQADLEEKKAAAQAKSQMVKDQAGELLSAIGEVRKNMNFFGFQGNIPPWPGSKKVNWDANMGKLVARNVLKIMNDMKSASRTGATGFGALSEKEMGLLQTAATALRKDLDSKDADRYLTQMESSLQKVIGSSGGEIYAVNPRTKQRIKSMDGGQTWESA